MAKNLYIMYALLVTFITTSAHVDVIDTATALQNKLAFIAQQKEVINQEEPKLIAAYKQAEHVLYEFANDYVDNLIDEIYVIVDRILETEEFTNYSEYMTDFQSSLIATGGLQAEELPTLNPDKALFIKINEIIKENLPLALQESSAAMTFLRARLTLKANFIGTQALLAKLTLKEQQLTVKIEALKARD